MSCCNKNNGKDLSKSFRIGEFTAKRYPSNAISTTRYNIITFLPLSLLF